MAEEQLRAWALEASETRDEVARTVFYNDMVNFRDAALDVSKAWQYFADDMLTIFTTNEFGRSQTYALRTDSIDKIARQFLFAEMCRMWVIETTKAFQSNALTYQQNAVTQISDFLGFSASFLMPLRSPSEVQFKKEVKALWKDFALYLGEPLSFIWDESIQRHPWKEESVKDWYRRFYDWDAQPTAAPVPVWASLIQGEQTRLLDFDDDDDIPDNLNPLGASDSKPKFRIGYTVKLLPQTSAITWQIVGVSKVGENFQYDLINAYADGAVALQRAQEDKEACRYLKPTEIQSAEDDLLLVGDMSAKRFLKLIPATAETTLAVSVDLQTMQPSPKSATAAESSGLKPFFQHNAGQVFNAAFMRQADSYANRLCHTHSITQQRIFYPDVYDKAPLIRTYFAQPKRIDGFQEMKVSQTNFVPQYKRGDLVLVAESELNVDTFLTVWEVQDAFVAVNQVYYTIRLNGQVQPIYATVLESNARPFFKTRGTRMKTFDALPERPNYNGLAMVDIRSALFYYADNDGDNLVRDPYGLAVVSTSTFFYRTKSKRTQFEIDKIDDNKPFTREFVDLDTLIERKGADAIQNFVQSFDERLAASENVDVMSWKRGTGMFSTVSMNVNDEKLGDTGEDFENFWEKLNVACKAFDAADFDKCYNQCNELIEDINGNDRCQTDVRLIKSLQIIALKEKTKGIRRAATTGPSTPEEEGEPVKYQFSESNSYPPIFKYKIDSLTKKIQSSDSENATIQTTIATGDDKFWTLVETQSKQGKAVASDVIRYSALGDDNVITGFHFGRYSGKLFRPYPADALIAFAVVAKFHNVRPITRFYPYWSAAAAFVERTFELEAEQTMAYHIEKWQTMYASAKVSFPYTGFCPGIVPYENFTEIKITNTASTVEEPSAPDAPATVEPTEFFIANSLQDCFDAIGARIPCYVSKTFDTQNTKTAIEAFIEHVRLHYRPFDVFCKDIVREPSSYQFAIEHDEDEVWSWAKA